MEGGDGGIHTWNLRISCEIAVICHRLFMTQYTLFFFPFFFFFGLLFCPFKGLYHYYGRAFKGRMTAETHTNTPTEKPVWHKLKYSMKILTILISFLSFHLENKHVITSFFLDLFLFSSIYSLTVRSKWGKWCRNFIPSVLRSCHVFVTLVNVLTHNTMKYNTMQDNQSLKYIWGGCRHQLEYTWTIYCMHT